MNFFEQLLKSTDVKVGKEPIANEETEIEKDDFYSNGDDDDGDDDDGDDDVEDLPVDDNGNYMLFPPEEIEETDEATEDDNTKNKDTSKKKKSKAKQKSKDVNTDTSSIKNSKDKTIEDKFKDFKKIIVKVFGNVEYEFTDEAEIKMLKLNELKERLILEKGYEEFTNSIEWNLINGSDKETAYLVPTYKFHSKG